MSNLRILVIEDEQSLQRVIRRGLESASYTVDTAIDGVEGLHLAQSRTYALIVLDVMLPGMDGWGVCEALRRDRVRTPVLMLTARSEVEDRVRGLELGADDYLIKPFAFPELLARTRALLRRDTVHKGRILRIADLVVDSDTRRVTRGGVEVNLSRREFDLLEAMVANEGRVLTRATILDRVWNNEESLSNTVDVYIGLLRKKLDATEPKLIHTVRGVGYTIRCGGEE
jgi:DNA-binding response OmpR family regulator